MCTVLRPRPLTDEVTAALRESVLVALRCAAGDDAELAHRAETRVADIEATPLLFARGVIHRKFLLQDAARIPA